MKITRRQLRRITRESLEGIFDSNFQFSFNPAEFINKELDVDQMHHMIDMFLDAEGINYVVERSRTGWSYEFGYANKDSTDPDPESYLAFLALRTELKNIGIPTLKDLYDKDLFGDVYINFSDSQDQNKTPVGNIYIRQSKRY